MVTVVLKIYDAINGKGSRFGALFAVAIYGYLPILLGNHRRFAHADHQGKEHYQDKRERGRSVADAEDLSVFLSEALEPFHLVGPRPLGHRLGSF